MCVCVHVLTSGRLTRQIAPKALNKATICTILSHSQVVHLGWTSQAQIRNQTQSSQLLTDDETRLSTLMSSWLHMSTSVNIVVTDSRTRVEKWNIIHLYHVNR